MIRKQGKKLGKVELPCKPTFEACFNNVIQVVDPKVKVECLFFPPDSHPDEAWCQWLFSIPEA